MYFEKNQENLSPGHAVIGRSWEVPEFRIDFWSGRRHEACVVIPVINEGERIRSLIRHIHELGVSEWADVMLVDGGSMDGSLNEEELRERGVVGQITKLGSGKLSAQLRCAYAFVLREGYSQIVTIDGNNKDDPEGISTILDALRGGADFVQGSRFVPGGAAVNTPKARDLAIRLVHAPMLSLFSGFRWTDTTQGFRGYSSRMLLDDRIAPFRNVFHTYELLAYLSYRAPKLKFKCVEVGTTRRYPVGAIPTKISPFRGNLDLMVVLFKSCFGRYNPR